MTRPRLIVLQILFATLLVASCHAGAPAKHPKISSAILDLMASGRLETEPDRQQFPGQPLSLTPEGLQVYIEMIEVSEGTLADLQALGVTIELADPGQRLVQARVPPAQIEAAAGLPGVRFIRLPDRSVSDR